MSRTWEQLGNKLIKQAQQKRVPISGQFELTCRCNLKCNMCYVAKPANDKEAILAEKSADEWIQLAREARNAGMLYLLLTGGEIFIRPDFKRIYEELSKMGFIIDLYSNATMITPEIAKWLGKIPPSRVGITMYGASPESYEKVCGNAAGYEAAVRGIDLLLAEGINVWLKTTVIRDNAKDFDEIAKFSESRGIQFGVVNYISPRREGCNTCPESQRLSPSELLEFEMHANEYFYNKSKENLNVKEPNNYSTECDIETDPLQKNPVNNTEVAFKCPSGKCAFWVTYDGRMTPCSLMNNPAAFPFKNNFETAWINLQELCSSVPTCGECSECSFKKNCMTCPARLFAETGSYTKPAQYLCEMAKLRSVY